MSQIANMRANFSESARLLPRNNTLAAHRGFPSGSQATNKYQKEAGRIRQDLAKLVREVN